MAVNMRRMITWWGVFLACLIPLIWLLYDGIYGDLGANPVEAVTHRSGDWALRLLLITLAMRPLQRLTGRPGWLRWRRMLGLYSFFYALLHGLTWVWLDQQWDLTAMIADVIKRPYITVGFLALVLLVPLAATSTRAAMRRLGRNWSRLHKLVYVIAPLGILHYVWLVKADWAEPAIYGVVLVIMLGLRLPPVVERLRRVSRPGMAASRSHAR